MNAADNEQYLGTATAKMIKDEMLVDWVHSQHEQEDCEHDPVLHDSMKKRKHKEYRDKHHIAS